MSEATLRFDTPPDGGALLLFGHTGGAVAPAPPATLGADAGLPGLRGPVTLRAARPLGLDAGLPGLSGHIPLRWDSGVWRGLRAPLHSHWQAARHLATAHRPHWQAARPHVTGLHSRWQAASFIAAASQLHWQVTDPRHAAIRPHWQSAAPLAALLNVRWQNTAGLRAAIRPHWQSAAPQASLLSLRWQNMIALRHANRPRWQEGRAQRAQARDTFTDAIARHQALRQHWQEAMRPPAGVSAVPRPPIEPCYDPATLGTLIFDSVWPPGDGLLVFVCQRAGQAAPPALIYIPPQRTYIVINDLHLARADDGTPIHADAFSMQLDADSWRWQWSASLPAHELDKITPGSDGLPVGVLASVNGVPYHLLAERYRRERQFAHARIHVQGRGRNALLDSPYAPAHAHGSDLTQTAQQLAQSALLINGVANGWTLDWQLPDWSVPADAWQLHGSPMQALADIAAAVRAMLLPHRADPIVRMLPRYQAAPWDWQRLTPAIELPAHVVQTEGIEWHNQPEYDLIYVSGSGAGGVFARVSRAGLPGDTPLPMAVHPLLTHADAARQRGLAELAATGRIAHVSLSLPVLPATGVIEPGQMLRYTDGPATRLGAVRSVSLTWQRPVLRQTLLLEVHE